MKKVISFPSLEFLLREMKAEYINWASDTSIDKVEFSIDAELSSTGVEVDIDEDITEDENGIFIFNGQRIFLYIKDTSRPKYIVLEEPEKTKKYHFSNCETLQTMRRNNRFERYVAIKRYDGLFPVNTQEDRYDDSTIEENVEAPLKVCKNCLKNINYKNYKESSFGEKKEIFSNFDIPEFFEEYDSSHTTLPTHSAEAAPIGTYNGEWAFISKEYRNSKKWCCESCGVNLSNKKNLLHTHHINGRKDDNRPSNLKALCVVCHASQPNHGHMRVNSSDKLFIKKRLGQVLAK